MNYSINEGSCCTFLKNNICLSAFFSSLWALF